MQYDASEQQVKTLLAAFWLLLDNAHSRVGGKIFACPEFGSAADQFSARRSIIGLLSTRPCPPNQLYSAVPQFWGGVTISMLGEKGVFPSL